MDRHKILKYSTAGVSLLLSSYCFFWAVVWEIGYWHKSVSDAFNASWWNWLLFPTFLIVAVLALSVSPKPSVKVESNHTGGDKMSPTKRSMPLWIGLLCAVCAVASLGFSVFAVIQEYEIYLPLVADLTVKPSQLTFGDINFIYDIDNITYTSATVGVQISSGVSTALRVNIMCYANQSVVADGTFDTSVRTGKVSVTVPLTWYSTYTVFDLTSIEIQVQQI